ncbi:hypothetical protein [Pseudomonas sp. ANT_H14]|uniref:hypothetical protein n=1 Tax=Pseudomonas sp. ANT_H14 TaxID=2597349 RepID=UPI0015B6D1D0|nr:hypothetical protein [Pseudomonas sp. ANT_H14]
MRLAADEILFSLRPKDKIGVEAPTRVNRFRMLVILVPPDIANSELKSDLAVHA